MNKEELLTLFSEILNTEGLLKAVGIHEVNHKPHPFMIGPKHIAASQDNGGVITEEICEKIKCASKGCKLKYSQHSADKTLFLQLTQDVYNTEATGELLKIKDALIDNKIEGVAFVDSEEMYRFLPDSEEDKEPSKDS